MCVCGDQRHMSVLLSSSDWEDSLGVFQSLTFQFLPNECLPFLVSSYTYFHAGTKFLALKISAINVQGCRNDTGVLSLIVYG